MAETWPVVVGFTARMSGGCVVALACRAPANRQRPNFMSTLRQHTFQSSKPMRWLTILGQVESPASAICGDL